MHKFKSLFILAACATFASATAVQRWTSSTVDTTTHHINTNSSSGKVALGATSTGPDGVGIGAKATGSNGYGVKAYGGIGVYGETVNGNGVWGYSTGSGTGVWGTAENVGTGGAGGQTGVWGIGLKGVWGYGADTGVVGSTYYSGGTGVVGYGNESGHGVVGVTTYGNGVKATSTYGTAISADGYNLGLDITTPNLYGTGINVVPGQRGTGLYTYNGQYGIYAQASSYDGYDNSYGIVGDAYGGGASYGVTGYAGGASGSGNDWAGWFGGAVYANSFHTPSDQKFKTNVRDYRGGLDKILALKIKSYDMKVDEFKGRMELPSGPQIGVIAQEAEKIFPEIVQNTKAPAKLTAEERKKGVQKQGEEFKSVNYAALIPVLVQAIQELQAEVDALKAGR